jgi:membrane-associated HD superfamily phosphohydrolase
MKKLLPTKHQSKFKKSTLIALVLNSIAFVLGLVMQVDLVIKFTKSSVENRFFFSFQHALHDILLIGIAITLLAFIFTLISLFQREKWQYIGYNIIGSFAAGILLYFPWWQWLTS